MRGSYSTDIARRLAQRRVALLLLPLRIWIGLAWLRSGVVKALQPEWLDGTALTGFIERQADAGTAPVSLYLDLVAAIVGRAPDLLGIALAGAQIAIGLGLLTGTLTNLALLTAVMLNVSFILAGVASPSQFYLIIEVVLLAGGAGAAYSVDRGLSRYLPSVVLTGHRGLVDGVDMPRAVLVILAIASGGLAVVIAPSIGAVLPEGGVDDPSFVLVGLLLLIALFAVALTSSTHRADDAREAQRWMDDPLGIGHVNGSATSSGLPPPPQSMPPPPQSMPPPPQSMPPPPPRDNPPPVSVPPGGRQVDPRPDDRMPAPAPPGHGQVDPLRAPTGPDHPSGQWPAPGPAGAPAPQPAPARPGPAARDQPTTQFKRPRRRGRPPAQPPDDPYAELRNLPPHQQ